MPGRIRPLPPEADETKSTAAPAAGCTFSVIHHAFALRELNRIEEAKAVLLAAEWLHGKTCGLLHYNLACYYCLLADIAEAKKRLSMACKMDKQWKEGALEDSDVKAIWGYIAAMK